MGFNSGFKGLNINISYQNPASTSSVLQTPRSLKTPAQKIPPPQKKRMAYFLLIFETKKTGKKIFHQRTRVIWHSSKDGVVTYITHSSDRTQKRSINRCNDLYSIQRSGRRARKTIKTEEKQQQAVQNNRPQQCKAILSTSRTGSGAAINWASRYSLLCTIWLKVNKR